MPDENLVRFPLVESAALELLREAAEDSRKLVNTVKFGEREWFERVSNRQIVLCLKEGSLVGGVTQDDHGNWRCVVTRVCGGLDVYVTVAIDTDDDNKVYVLEVENRHE